MKPKTENMNQALTQSKDPLKKRVVNNIILSRTSSQLQSSIRYAELAGMKDDEQVKEWIEFRKLLVFPNDINNPF